MNGFFSFDFSRNGKCWKFGCLAFVQKRISPGPVGCFEMSWNQELDGLLPSPAGVQGVTPNKHRETIITASSGVSSLSSLEKQKGSITKTGWLSQGPNNTRNWWFDQAKWGWSYGKMGRNSPNISLKQIIMFLGTRGAPAPPTKSYSNPWKKQPKGIKRQVFQHVSMDNPNVSLRR